MYLIYKAPIFNREGELFGYEVFARPKGACIVYLQNTENSLNTLINFFIEENITDLFKDKKVIIPLDCECLNVELLNLLIPKNVVLKISLRNGVSEKLLKDLKILKNKGFELLLDGLQFENPNCISIIKNVNYLSLSVKDLEKLKNIKKFVELMDKRILLTDIESEEEYKAGIKFADFLQGSYLSLPQLFRHYKNYKFLSNFFVKLIKQIREKTKGELYILVKGDKNLRKILEHWCKEFYPEQKIDSLELRIIIFLYLIKDLFIHSEGKNFMKVALFRAFLMREFARLLVPERTREAFITGLLSSCEEFLEISSVKLAQNLNYPDDIIEALKFLRGDIGYILSNVYIMEACAIRNEVCSENICNKLAFILNRKTREIKGCVERAKKKMTTLLTLLHRNEVLGNIDLQQRNKLTQL